MVAVFGLLVSRERRKGGFEEVAQGDEIAGRALGEQHVGRGSIRLHNSGEMSGTGRRRKRDSLTESGYVAILLAIYYALSQTNTRA